MTLAFYLDEHIDPELAKTLSNRGHKVMEAREQASGESDKHHLRKASEEDAVIITMDDDFLKIVENREEHPGIIKVNKYYRTKHLADRIEESTEKISQTELRNTTIYI